MSAPRTASLQSAWRRGALPGLRSGLLALAMLAGLGAPACAPVAHAFDRQAQTERYARWVEDFQRDFRKLSGLRDPSDADIERLFADTIVPGSRAVDFVRLLSEQPEGSAAGGIAFQGPARLVFGVLRDAVVAGDGGLYTDQPKDRAPLQLRVWYLHIDGGGLLEPYFNDPEAFKPYGLPPEGTLTRHAYPFLLFEEGPRLRLGAITQEFWGVIRFLDNKQHG
ncbi:hypothetical protein [Bordetella genomosp. 13]|uniref:hypothetical protein n=1 Tax=Bordetella genomosp. 13 TaxID=463040 RepID=UPI00119D4B60|nr:hypothetical protein [Bordetella genomosp. 13]